MAVETEETSTIPTSTVSKPSNEEHSDRLSKSIIGGSNESEKIALASVKNEYEERRQQLQYQQALLRSQSEQHLSYNQETEHAETLNSSLRTDASQVRD